MVQNHNQNPKYREQVNNKPQHIAKNQPKQSSRPRSKSPCRTHLQSAQNESTETEIYVATALNRNTVFLSINDKKIQALVDSGASVSCLQKAAFDRINKENAVKVQPSKIRNIVGVGGERHEVHGQVSLTLNISGLLVEQTFIIVEQLHHSLILGLDFLKMYQVVIDFDRKVLIIGNDAIVVALACDSKYGYARCIKTETIPAESEVVIPVKLSGGQKVPQCYWSQLMA